MSKLKSNAFICILSAWLTAVTAELLLTGKGTSLSDHTVLAASSGIRVALTAVFLSAGLFLWVRYAGGGRWVRWLPFAAVFAYCITALHRSFTWLFLICCLLLITVLFLYAAKGWDGSVPAAGAFRERKLWYILTGVLALLFFCFVSAWTVARVRCFYAPTYDFGIFSQMFHYMKQTGLPLTTLERDGLLSHFAVHLSPVYYLLLPVYCLFPHPETLQILQAAILAAAVIPMWKLGKHHALPPVLRTVLCALLLVFPAYAGGTGYDIHENCFLTPCLLWLLYGVDRENGWLTCAFSLLTLMIKEDAPVYVAVIAMYLLVRGLLYKKTWGMTAGVCMLVGALAWFLAATAHLSVAGEGVMNYRYENFLYDGSGSLLTVVKAVLLCPIKAVFECVDGQKLPYIACTLLPLLGLPLLTRRFERYILLIPYILINLMSDYKYQHDLFFQYNFGSVACLMYLTAVNLTDIKRSWLKYSVSAAALCSCVVLFCALLVPKAYTPIHNCVAYGARYDAQRQLLSTIPQEDSVAATTFLAPQLSERMELYDIRYAAMENILSCRYVVLNPGEASAFKRFASADTDGIGCFVDVLTDNGYRLEHSLPGMLEIYRKAGS